MIDASSGSGGVSAASVLAQSPYDAALAAKLEADDAGMRYSRDQSFAVIAWSRRFVLMMAAGSILGALIGGRLLGVVPRYVLLPSLAAILVVSAVTTWTHAKKG